MGVFSLSVLKKSLCGVRNKVERARRQLCPVHGRITLTTGVSEAKRELVLDLERSICGGAVRITATLLFPMRLTVYKTLREEEENHCVLDFFRSRPVQKTLSRTGGGLTSTRGVSSDQSRSSPWESASF